MNDKQEIVTKIDNIQKQLDTLQASKDITIENQNSLSERLGTDKSFLNKFMLFGTVTLVAGYGYVYDGRITATSVPMAIPTTATVPPTRGYGASVQSGKATLFSGDATDTSTLNYIIIL